MNQGFGISFLYLLLVIPQHGNTPLPDVVSSLQKDQDEGTLKQNLTSSLAGIDKSSESAEQSFQNSLIRKKRSSSSELTLKKRGSSNFNVYSRIKRQPLLYGGHVKEEISLGENSDKGEAMFEGFGGNPRSSPGAYYFGTPHQRFQNPENTNLQYKNAFLRENQYIDIIPSQDLLHNNRMNNLYRKDFDTPDKEVNPRVFLQKQLQQKYTPNSFLYYPQTMVDGGLNYPIQEDYIDDGRRGREIRDQEYRNPMGSEGKIPQTFDENEYYDTDMGSFLGEEDDYNQLLDNRRYIRKRNEARLPVPRDDEVAREAYEYEDQEERFMNYAPGRNIRRDRPNLQYPVIKTREAARRPESNYVWKVGDEFQSQELKDLLKNSQKALQEVQMFQNKLSYKPSENMIKGHKRENQNPFEKCEKRNYVFDGYRLKREDEDEQKNMKTGTDEGGGEYEDEEGKGHKDEEEYYEDADLSENESVNGGLSSAEMNQKYVKRDVLKDAHLNRAKNGASDQSEDYELNLENAPVEHAEKSKKSTYREGEKTNKNTERKGVKIWDQWGKWSPCSVTCGIGRSTRWRHCIGGGCAQGEKEAQIKKCTNPAC